MKRRRIITNTIDVAIEGARRIDRAHVVNLRTILELCLQRFCSGNDCEEMWRGMADAMNMAESLAEIGICSDAQSRSTILHAQRVLAAVADRAARRCSWTLRWDEERESHERELLDKGIWLHLVQLEHCSMSEYQRAMDRTAARVRAALAGNAGRGVTVVQLQGVAA